MNEFFDAVSKFAGESPWCAFGMFLILSGMATNILNVRLSCKRCKEQKK